MAPFLSYREQLAPGRAGDPFDTAISKDDISLIACYPQARQVSTIAITAVNATLYTITINGVAATYTSDADATQAEISAGLRDALYADPAISGLISATTGTDLVLRSAQPGLAYTISVGANLALTATTANAAAQPVPFGAAIAFDPEDQPSSDRRQGGALLSAVLATLDGDVLTFTPTPVNDTIYQIVLSVDGVQYVASYTSDADATAAEIVAGLSLEINDTLEVPGVTATGSTTLILTADPGVSVQATSFSPQLALVTTAGDGGLSLFAGISLRQDTEEMLSAVGASGYVDGYPAHSTMSVRRKGRVRVLVDTNEDAPTPTKGAPVFVRIDSGDGTLFRTAPGAGCVPLAGWTVYKTEEDGLMVIQN